MIVFIDNVRNPKLFSVCDENYCHPYLFRICIPDDQSAWVFSLLQKGLFWKVNEIVNLFPAQRKFCVGEGIRVSAFIGINLDSGPFAVALNFAERKVNVKRKGGENEKKENEKANH